MTTLVVTVIREDLGHKITITADAELDGPASPAEALRMVQGARHQLAQIEDDILNKIDGGKAQ